MSERNLRIVLVAITLVVGSVGGYLFGFATARSAERSLEAVHDLLVPVDDLRRERVRRDGIRGLTATVADLQSDFFEANERYASLDSIPVATEGYVLEVHPHPGWYGYRLGNDIYWSVVVRHLESPHGEVCAVALDREPVYTAGILLKREGRVRCSWDLATRLNRWLR